MRGSGIAVAAMLALLPADRAAAQEGVPPAAGTEAAPVPTPARPKPRPKPKPAPKVEPPTAPEPASPEPSTPAPASPSQGAFAAPVIACDPGQAVQYDGPKDVALWVTRTGTVTIQNPLRPLTPDVTRVLQLVIGNRIATAYGADLRALRRGAAPAALEAALGGPIHWDPTLGSLPDTLNIVADSGATLAELRFKTCGEAPAAQAAPVARTKPERRAPAARRKAAPAAEAPAAAPPGQTAPRPAPNLPRGALPD